MPLIEIDDGELKNLRGQAAQARDALPSKILLDKMGKNPKTRAAMLKLMKEIQPDLVIPELDAAAPVLDEVGKLQGQLAELRKQLSEKDAEESKRKTQADIDAEITKGRSSLREQGWMPEGIAAVEKLMQDRGITDYDAAAALYERQNPKEQSTIPSNFGRSMGLLDPPEDNPWAKAVRLPKGPGQVRALKSAQDGEINKWFQENRPAMRARA